MQDKGRIGLRHNQRNKVNMKGQKGVVKPKIDYNRPSENKPAGESDDKNKMEFDAVVLETLPGTEFRVEIELNGMKRKLVGYISGKMRQHFIKIFPGDRVKVEITPYDLNRGRITYRYK